MNGEWFGALGVVAGAAAGAAVNEAGRTRRSMAAMRRRSSAAETLDAQKLRDELWKELHDLRHRLDAMAADLDKTRLAYIELMGNYTVLRAEHKALQREHENLRKQFEQPHGRG